MKKRRKSKNLKLCFSIDKGKNEKMKNEKNKRHNEILKYLLKTNWPVFINCESCGNQVGSNELLQTVVDVYVEFGESGLQQLASQELEMDCPECNFRIYLDYDDSEDQEDANRIREIIKDFIRQKNKGKR